MKELQKDCLELATKIIAKRLYDSYKHEALNPPEFTQLDYYEQNRWISLVDVDKARPLADKLSETLKQES